MLREKPAMKCQCHNARAKTLLPDIFSRLIPNSGFRLDGRDVFASQPNSRGPVCRSSCCRQASQNLEYRDRETRREENWGREDSISNLAWWRLALE